MRALRVTALLALAIAAAPGAARGAHLNVATISGSINPASADYLIKAIEQSETEGAVALLIELDTPGGLVASTKDIIQKMLNASIPVVVYVAPRGAWASSAGAFITLAGHVAAMAPGTSIGAAHPVGVGGGGGGSPLGEDEKGEKQRDYSMEKAENFLAAFIESIAKERKRNVEWAVKAVRDSVAITDVEALEIGVIDLVAQDRADLLEQIDGREVDVAGTTVRLELAGVEVRSITMTGLTRFLDVLADPNIAMILFMAGLLGLYVEFTNPGVILPGVAGAVCLILAFLSLQILPFSWLGLMLILAGIALLVAEIFVPSFGLLFVTGCACFLLGGSMMFDLPTVSDLTVSFWAVLVPAVTGVAIFGGVVVYAVGRSFTRAQVSGVNELVGLEGRVTTALSPEGKVFVRGEYWSARAEGLISADEPVEVMAVEGMRLRVRRTTARG